MLGRGVFVHTEQKCEVTVYSDGASQSTILFGDRFRSMLKAQDHVP
jgi:hypothetical protein